MTPVAPRPQVWAGVESSFLRVRRRVRDQLSETGHADRAGDLARLEDVGASAVRYPVLWGRAPGGRPISPTTDWSWAVDRLGRLRALGVEPIVELLHHGFGPLDADPFDPGWPERFGAYAGMVARRFPWVRRWLPINEPLTTARFAGLYGWWWPHHAGRETFVRLLLAQIEGWRAAARAIRAIIPGAELLVNEDAGTIGGAPEVARAVAHDRERRWLTFDLLTGRVRPGHPLWVFLASVPGAATALERIAGDPIAPDVLGLDYYLTSDRWLDHRLHAFPPESHGGGHGLRYADIEAVRVGGGVDIQGWAAAIAGAWERYRLPLALTEVQLAGELGDQVAWWREAWEAAVAATDRGVPVVAVTAWSVFGSWDWDSVLLGHRRTFEPGCLSPAPRFSRPHPLEGALRRTVRDGHPGPSPDGWWRRPDRVRYHPRVLWRPDIGASAAVTDLPSELVAAAP
jgi:dTDP-4-dehydrorhamnose reductase